MVDWQSVTSVEEGGAELANLHMPNTNKDTKKLRCVERLAAQQDYSSGGDERDHASPAQHAAVFSYQLG